MMLRGWPSRSEWRELFESALDRAVLDGVLVVCGLPLAFDDALVAVLDAPDEEKAAAVDAAWAVFDREFDDTGRYTIDDFEPEGGGFWKGTR